MLGARRSFLKAMGLAALLDPGGIERILSASRQLGNISPERAAREEDFWREVQQSFTVDRSIINLNNGGVSPSPRSVQEAMRRYLEYSNHAPAYTMWQVLEPQIEGVRRGLAAEFGCDPEEIAITRNASEALQICIFGLDLKPGDEVLTTWQDYPRMINALRQRERRDGIKLKIVEFQIPPPSMGHLKEAFERAMTNRTRAILVSHMTFTTGQIFPIMEISQMGRQRGIEVIVDGAHAFAHFPFKHGDLDCDYYGTSLHKWLMAPHGTGFLYVRKSKIKGLWPLMAAEPKQDGDIRKFEEIGTHPAANHNAIAEALVFHRGIGIERKAARLRYLRDRWALRLSSHERVRMLTPLDARQSCAIGTFNVAGLDVARLAAHLWERYRILVTPIDYNGLKGIRVTPSLYTTLDEIDFFCDAIEKVLRGGLPA
jgi:selenocysteine lyase/cysteine desulfurase